MLNKCVWNPWILFQENQIIHKYAVLVLNKRINVCLQSSLLLNIWNNASVRITVDGGTDQWLSWLERHNIKNSKNPDLVTGDMDSIKIETLNYFMNGETKIIPTLNQDETDFTKALKELQNYIYLLNIKIDSVLVIVDSSGRFDQIMANTNTLFKALNFYREVNIFQLAKDSLTWLLNVGTHKITVPDEIKDSSEWCALMPIGSKCRATTTGLKWNLNNTILEFGHMVSTSNAFNGEREVFVETDNILVWSMGIASFFR